MKIIKPLIFLSILLLFSSCIEDDSEPQVKTCISNWRSGDWETNYGFLGSGILEDPNTGETCTFRGTFKANEDGDFGVTPIKNIGNYCVDWAHVWYGKSDCTPEFLISTYYATGGGSTDLTAIKNNSGKIEVSGEFYEINSNGVRFLVGRMYFISDK